MRTAFVVARGGSLHAPARQCAGSCSCQTTRESAIELTAAQRAAVLAAADAVRLNFASRPIVGAGDSVLLDAPDADQ